MNELDIVEYYLKPCSIKETCKKFHIGEKKLYRILEENGVKRRTRELNGTRIHSFNMDFFKKESQDLAYFLGLMGADGCIASKTNQIYIELQNSDKELLENIKRSLELSREIKEYTNKQSRYKCAKLYIENKELKNILINQYGLCPNKTYDIEHFNFPNISSEYYADYIRGYFDGDGSIKITNYSLTFQIDGSNYKLLQRIQNILENETSCHMNIILDTPSYKDKYEAHNRKIPLYRLYCYGQNAKKVYEFIYHRSDMNLYLKRKYLFYLQYKESH